MLDKYFFAFVLIPQKSFSDRDSRWVLIKCFQHIQPSFSFYSMSSTGPKQYLLFVTASDISLSIVHMLIKDNIRTKYYKHVICMKKKEQARQKTQSRNREMLI